MTPFQILFLVFSILSVVLLLLRVTAKTDEAKKRIINWGVPIWIVQLICVFVYFMGKL